MFKPKSMSPFFLFAAAHTFPAIRTARARMPAVPDAQLKKPSSLIIEAVVVSTRLTHSKSTARLKRTRYRSELKISRTLMGDKRPAETPAVDASTGQRPVPQKGKKAAGTGNTRAARRKRCGCGYGHRRDESRGGASVLLMLLAAGLTKIRCHRNRIR